MWKFRFYLTNQKQALTKFLKCVKWDVPHEEKQALDLLRRWSPVDVVDALELLSPHFKNQTVRRYAVTRLKQANDEVTIFFKHSGFGLKYMQLEITHVNQRSD